MHSQCTYELSLMTIVHNYNESQSINKEPLHFITANNTHKFYCYKYTRELCDSDSNITMDWLRFLQIPQSHQSWKLQLLEQPAKVCNTSNYPNIELQHSQ